MKTYTEINEARVAMDPEIKRIRYNLKQQIKNWKAKGKDTTDLEAQLDQLNQQIEANKLNNASSPASTPTHPSNASADWNNGYQAAIEAIKNMKNNKNNSQSGGSGSGSDSGLEGIPMDPNDQNNSQNNNSSGSGSDSGSSKQSRNGKQKGTGVVRPEDCIDPSKELDKMPDTAGGMMSKQDGDKLAEAEGYDPEGGSDDSVAKDWEERAKQASKQMPGKGEGYQRLKNKFDEMYRTTKDWKKELKKIVGNSISPDEKRQAYANKNILISQNRIARTDKDKYENMDYMMAWIDTSGSMTQEYLNQCLCEIYQVALAKKPLKLVIVQFDTRIADVQEFKSVQDLKCSMKTYQIKGGGGTEVKPCFDMLLNDPKYKRRQCELVMIFTDGYLEQYKRNPKTMRNLVWVVVDNVSFELKYKDINTKVVRLKSEDFGR